MVKNRMLGLLLACVLAFPAAAGATPVSRPYFAVDGSKDSIYLEWALHPQAIRDGDTTFAVYQGPGLEPYATALDHTTGSWTPAVRVGDNPLTTDMHGAPALAIDGDGYLHVFYGGHHSPLRHARSRYPRSVTSWIDLPAIAASFTYPQPIVLSDGTIDLFYRNGALEWVEQRSLDNGATWSAPKRILGKSASWGFYASFARGVGNEVVASFVAIDWDLYFTGTSWARRDLHFMRRGFDGVWRDDGGTALTLPLTKAAADTTTRVFASGSANTNHPTVKVAPDGDPCLLFSTGAGSGPDAYSYRFMRLDGGAWSSAKVASTDHFFDACTLRFAGDGSLQAFTSEGGTSGTGKGDRDYTDDGGLLVRRVSDDGGLTWPAEGTVISPAVPGAIYSNPQVVEAGPDDGALLLNEWTRGPSLFGLKLYLLGDDGATWGRTYEPSLKRLAGRDRIGTAVAVSREAFPVGSDAAVIASSSGFADALAGGPLAYALGGPVLLSPRTGLGTANRAELKRLAPSRVVVLGGRNALSDQVANDVRAVLPKATIERIAGTSRYATAASVSTRLRAVRGRPDAAFVVSGSRFADAASACAWAAYRGRPILLAEKDWLPDDTARAIDSLDVDRCLVVGDSSSIGSGVAARLPGVERLSGADRYETSAIVAAASLDDGMLADRFVIAGGSTYPDSLTSSVLAARLRAPVLLTAPAALRPSARSLIAENFTTTIRAHVVGGTASVSTGVGADVVGLMNGSD